VSANAPTALTALNALPDPSGYVNDLQFADGWLNAVGNTGGSTYSTTDLTGDTGWAARLPAAPSGTTRIGPLAYLVGQSYGSSSVSYAGVEPPHAPIHYGGSSSINTTNYFWRGTSPAVAPTLLVSQLRGSGVTVGLMGALTFGEDRWVFLANQANFTATAASMALAPGLFCWDNTAETFTRILPESVVSGNGTNAFALWGGDTV
jgi:hypothetical protein